MSNQPKHTPGDWTAVRSGGIGYFEWFVRIDGEARAIASDIIDPETGQPSEANARLIAAAPKMADEIEQLKQENAELLARLDTLTLVIGLTPILGNKDALQEAMDQARAAIAKAKGREA